MHKITLKSVDLLVLEWCETYDSLHIPHGSSVADPRLWFKPRRLELRQNRARARYRFLLGDLCLQTGSGANNSSRDPFRAAVTTSLGIVAEPLERWHWKG